MKWPEKPKAVLTEEFAERVREATVVLPDNTRLVDLLNLVRQPSREAREATTVVPEWAKWFDFVSQMTVGERRVFSRTLGSAIRGCYIPDVGGINTLGALRDASLEQLQKTREFHSGVGPYFLKTAFERLSNP